MKKIGCVFDCDGTLMDSMGAWKRVEEELAVLCGRGLTRAEQEALSTFTQEETSIFYHTTFGLGKKPEDVLTMMDDIFIDYYGTQVELRPGVAAFLEGLARAAVPMTMASSSPQRYLQPGIRRTGIGEYLKLVLSTDDVNAPKREPLIYQRAAEAMGTPVASTWGFEDAIYAVRTLVNNGFKCAGVYDFDESATLEQLRSEAHFVIESFRQVSVEAFLEQAQRLD